MSEEIKNGSHVEASYALPDFPDSRVWQNFYEILGFVLVLGSFIPLVYPLASFGMLLLSLTSKYAALHLYATPRPFTSVYVNFVLQNFSGLLFMKASATLLVFQASMKMETIDKEGTYYKWDPWNVSLVTNGISTTLAFVYAFAGMDFLDRWRQSVAWRNLPKCHEPKLSSLPEGAFTSYRDAFTKHVVDEQDKRRNRLNATRSGRQHIQNMIMALCSISISMAIVCAIAWTFYH